MTSLQRPGCRCGGLYIGRAGDRAKLDKLIDTLLSEDDVQEVFSNIKE